MEKFRAPGWTPEEEAILLAMCKAHDREEAAQMGEPDPWKDEGAGYDYFVHERLWAMNEALQVAKAAFMEQLSQSFCRGYNKAVADTKEPS